MTFPTDSRSEGNRTARDRHDPPVVVVEGPAGRVAAGAAIQGDHLTDPEGRLTQKAYRGVWALLALVFRVPERPPTVPRHGDGAAVEAFKPSRNYLRYLRMWFWILLVLIDLAILIVWISIFIGDWFIGVVLAPLALVIAILPDVVAWVALHLRYDTTWYILTDRSVRIRRGIFVIHETTITYENVQNVRVSQGPVQRYFGISSIIIETAGSGGGGGGGGNAQQAALAMMNRGVIEGVENAEVLRDLIMSRLRRSRSAGLGDDEEDDPEDDHPLSGSERERGDADAAPVPFDAAASSADRVSRRSRRGHSGMWTAAHLDALREIRDLVRERRGGG